MSARPIPDDFVNCVNLGFSRKELWEHFGVSHKTVARWLESLGIDAVSDVNGRRPSFRKSVQDMKPVDAVEYLLTVIEALLPPIHATDPRRKMGFSHIQCDMLSVLCRFDYLSVEQATLISMRGRDYDTAPDISAVRSHITKTRRLFETYGFAAQIKTDRIRGSQLGWILVRQNGFRFPWEAR